MTEAILALVHAPVADNAEAAIGLALVRGAAPAEPVRAALGEVAGRPTGRARLFGTAAANLYLEWAAVIAAVAALDGDADAVVAGAAVACAVADGLGPSHAAAGWCVETTAGAVGAAAASARVLGLRRLPLRHAIGIAATQASGLSAVQDTALGAAQVGHAAATGVEAALLARNGFTAAEDPLAGRRGLFAVMRPVVETGQ
ncbi:MmgE/PrpD family protein [Amycolatopsis rhabdoformis]|uniref:MmgE/PrpD family protein n=1 Tax=Amycolatopsis rhabdoformis TaxID=1448059 RepID=A0ABZ1IBN9_9PSEU|nr:MmgE/PrpD family protein [Amycolatopsis rhabdoformis]WSE31891.1 MmgE/PrpD family protein [Amycolatopsis rhabdoformis]